MLMLENVLTPILLLPLFDRQSFILFYLYCVSLLLSFVKVHESGIYEIYMRVVWTYSIYLKIPKIDSLLFLLLWLSPAILT